MISVQPRIGPRGHRLDVRRTGRCVAHRDVEADPELRAEYGDRMSVILVGGCEYGFWRVEAAFCVPR
jgi:hypothetical protein